MNLKEYISSGIVESYVLGVATPEEKAEFERMCAVHPDVRAARDAFERKLEEHAMQNAIKPSEKIKEKIFAEIEIGASRPSFDTLGTEIYPHAKEEEDPSDVEATVNISWKYLAAASIILLVGSIALNLYFFNKYQDSSSRYEALLTNQSALISQTKNMESRLKEKENTIFMMKDTGMMVIKMPGKNVPASPDPDCMATIYWDKRTKDVFLIVNSIRPPETDKQYQLWAMVNGKLVDAGVFDVDDPNIRLRMKTIPKAQAFAVTLEKRGGSTSPNMQAMYMMGKV